MKKTAIFLVLVATLSQSCLHAAFQNCFNEGISGEVTEYIKKGVNQMIELGNRVAPNGSVVQQYKEFSTLFNHNQTLEQFDLAKKYAGDIVNENPTFENQIALFRSNNENKETFTTFAKSWAWLIAKFLTTKSDIRWERPLPKSFFTLNNDINWEENTKNPDISNSTILGAAIYLLALPEQFRIMISQKNQ